MADRQGDEGPKVCQDAVGDTTYREAAMITWRFVKTKADFFKTTDGGVQFAEEFRCFPFGQNLV